MAHRTLRSFAAQDAILALRTSFRARSGAAKLWSSSMASTAVSARHLIAAANARRNMVLCGKNMLAADARAWRIDHDMQLRLLRTYGTSGSKLGTNLPR